MFSSKDHVLLGVLTRDFSTEFSSLVLRFKFKRGSITKTRMSDASKFGNVFRSQETYLVNGECKCSTN